MGQTGQVYLSIYNEAVIPYYRVGQHQHTGWPHNSLRARLMAARVYTYIEKVGGVGKLI
jgi:hypothetical protein